MLVGKLELGQLGLVGTLVLVGKLVLELVGMMVGMMVELGMKLGGGQLGLQHGKSFVLEQ